MRHSRRTVSSHRTLVLIAIVAVLVSSAAPSRAAGPKPIGTLGIVGTAGLEAISVVGFEWKVVNTPPPSGSGGGTSKITSDPFKVTKLLDATSPALLELTVDSTMLPVVRLTVTLRRGVTATYELKEAVLVSNDRHAPESGPLLQEIAFSAGSVRETITSAGGEVTTCYSFNENVACGAIP